MLSNKTSLQKHEIKKIIQNTGASFVYAIDSYLLYQLMYCSKSQIIPVFSRHLQHIYYMQIHTIYDDITLHFKICTSSWSSCNYILYTEIHWFMSNWNDSTSIMVTLVHNIYWLGTGISCKFCNPQHCLFQLRLLKRKNKT